MAAVLVTGVPHELLTTTLNVPVVKVDAKCTVNVLVPAPEIIVAPVGTVQT